MSVVRLRHVTRFGDWKMYFYDGELPVVDSTLTIPADRPEWIQRAWIQGFRMTADGRVIADLAKHIRSETQSDEQSVDSCCSDECCQPETEELALACCKAEDCCADDDTDCGCLLTPVEPEAETENAESDEENNDEGPDAGGQPAGDDGVREGEPTRDERIPDGGNGSRDGDEPAVEGGGDGTAD